MTFDLRSNLIEIIDLTLDLVQKVTFEQAYRRVLSACMLSCTVIFTVVYWTVNTMWLQCIVFLLVTHYAESSFQERHKMIILPKTESCFFLENMQEGYELNIRYLVMSSKNGKQLDITMRLRDNTKRMITYQVDRSYVMIGCMLCITRGGRHTAPTTTQ